MLTAQETETNPSDYEALTAPLLSHFKELDKFFEAQLDEFEPDIRGLVSDSIQTPGKLLRPILVFYAGWTPVSTPHKDLIKAAAVIELVHQATLVHDDILDSADIRHNKPTIARKHGSHAAVLLGDALFAHSLKLASDFPTVDICSAVSEATRKACAGEIAQSLNNEKATFSIKDYFRIIELKTAELFRVSCYLGAKVSGQDNAFIDAASEFGRHLGIAYQIFDDIADLIGSEADIGKTLGTDWTGGRNTLPLILLKEEVNIHTLENGKNGDVQKHLDSIRALLAEHEIPERAMEVLNNQIDSAISAIKPFDSLPAAAQLGKVAAFVKDRSSQLSWAKAVK